MELFFEVLLEGALQLLFGLLTEIGIHGTSKGNARRASRRITGLVYLALGTLAGWASAVLFPTLYLTTSAARFLNLMLTPLAAAGLLVMVGAWRSRRHHPLIGLNRFVYAYLFALALTVARLVSCI